MQLTVGLPQRFADQMGALLGPDFPTDIGLAVSGGGDSMAMLHLAAGWARKFGIQLWVVTVDHGLRDASASEAKMVKAECDGLNLPHSTLVWDGWNGTGNVQDAARRARRDLINRWRGGVEHVLFAHTQDDQAETFLMRLTRGSGVDGLSGMRKCQIVKPTEQPLQPIRVPNGPPWPPTRHGHWRIMRPLLEETRSELRHYSQTLKIPYVDDPTNMDEAFARIRVRKFLNEEGLDQSRLVATQKSMARAQEALAKRAHDAAVECLRPVSPREFPSGMPGVLRFDRDNFAKIEVESQLRIMSGALQSVTGATYRPRLATLEAALEKVVSGGKTTLQGAVLVPRGGAIFVSREFSAVANSQTPVGSEQLWDNRFVIYGADIEGFYVRPLGPEGATLMRKHRETTVPWEILQGQPGVWDGQTLVAYSALGFGPKYVWESRGGAKDFPKSLLTH